MSDFILCCSLYGINKDKNKSFQTVTVPYSTKTKDGQTYLEYHDEDVQDSVYEAVLHQCYKMFKVRN